MWAEGHLTSRLPETSHPRRSSASRLGRNGLRLWKRTSLILFMKTSMSSLSQRTLSIVSEQRFIANYDKNTSLTRVMDLSNKECANEKWSQLSVCTITSCWGEAKLQELVRDAQMLGSLQAGKCDDTGIESEWSLSRASLENSQF